MSLLLSFIDGFEKQASLSSTGKAMLSSAANKVKEEAKTLDYSKINPLGVPKPFRQFHSQTYVKLPLPDR
jgi:hypothetical protein